jgi:hypothetical protein
MAAASLGAERQLPAGNEIFLDHVAHFVRDGAAASRAMIQAGFAPTPASVQSNPGPDGAPVLTGTSNVTAMMRRGYIEVLFKSSESPLTREFDDGLARYPGPHLIAFATADAIAASARLAAAGFRTALPVSLRRPVGTETGEAEAAFTVARVMPGEMREGRIQFLTHHTEDAVWQKRWLAHPNGAFALMDAVVAVGDVDEATARFARFFGRSPTRTPLGQGFFLDRGGVQLVNRAAFAELAPAAAMPALPFIGLYALGVDDLAATEALLRRNGLSPERRGAVLLQPFPQALGTGAWLFAARAADLPWRQQT